MLKVGVSTSKSLLSKVIRWFTRSKASHAYFATSMVDTGLVLHANQHGVNFDLYNKTFDKYRVVKEWTLDVTEEQEKAILKTALSKLDVGYDFGSFVGFGVVLIAKALGFKIKNPFASGSAYMCSELVIMSLREAGIEGADKMDQELTSPEDVMIFLDNHPKAEPVE